MPPQEPVQSPKNKNSIIIGMLAVLIILAAYIAFFKKGNDEDWKNGPLDTTVGYPCGIDGSECGPEGQTQTNQNPTGADYQPNQNQGGDINSQNSVVTLDLSTVLARQYKTALTTALGEPADFDGHYKVASIGCGTGCFTYIAVDKNTGKIYTVPESNDFGNYISNTSAYNVTSNLIRVITSNGSKIKMYSFDGVTFTLVSTTSTFNTYTDHGFSFGYTPSATVRSGSIQNGYYSELTAPGDFVSVKFYPGALPSTYNSAFFTQSTMINGKTFKYGDVQTGGGVSRTYQYQKNGKTITIQLSHTTSTLIDLGSIEIN